MKLDPLLDFRGKVVLITGAAQGFGKMLAEELAVRGAKTAEHPRQCDLSVFHPD